MRYLTILACFTLLVTQVYAQQNPPSTIFSTESTTSTSGANLSQIGGNDSYSKSTLQQDVLTVTQTDEQIIVDQLLELEKQNSNNEINSNLPYKNLNEVHTPKQENLQRILKEILDKSPMTVRQPDANLSQQIEFLPKESDLDINLLQSGIGVTYEHLSQQIQDTQILEQLQQSQPIQLNLEDLGLTMPTEPVDLYYLYQDGKFFGLVSRPPGYSAKDFEIDLETAAKNEDLTVEPRVAQFGDKVVSNLNHFIKSVVFGVCRFEIRPQTLNLKVKGEFGALFTSIGAEAWVNIDLKSTCDN